MKCPYCGTEYKCPCQACFSEKSNWKRINMSNDGKDWNEVCPGCGKSESVHWWFEEMFSQFLAKEVKEKK